MRFTEFTRRRRRAILGRPGACDYLVDGNTPMAFEFSNGETPQRAVRRIVKEQFASALEHAASATDETVDIAVHEIRKSLKRVRSVLRLVRDSIGVAAYRFENDSLRDVARPLSAIRDAKALADALGKLNDRLERSDAGQAYEQAAAALSARSERVRSELILEHALSTVQPELKAALKRVNKWARLPKRWRAVGKGIKRVYRRGRDAHRQVHVHPTADALHEWRKQAKYLRHQLELFAPMRPEELGQLAAQLKTLGDLLGEDHDLTVLAQVLSEEGEGLLEPEALDAMSAVIAVRRHELRDEAMARGELLYRDRPKEFLGRIEPLLDAMDKEQKQAARGHN
jgi:CHAD domain-containing protein